MHDSSAGDRDPTSLRRSPGERVVGDLFPAGGSALVVARPDGSDRRVLHVGCSYAVAAWSPDGRKLLVMKDVSGFHFAMLAVSVDAPYETVPIVGGVRVNHPRSWPGHGDVSWQPSRS
jgi:hypothetical protein